MCNMTGDDFDRLGIAAEDLKVDTFQVGAGCPACRDTGYRGRSAICELLVVDEPIREKIQARANATEIRDVAKEGGMRLMRDDGMNKILAGITTPGEVARVTVRARL